MGSNNLIRILVSTKLVLFHLQSSFRGTRPVFGSGSLSRNFLVDHDITGHCFLPGQFLLFRGNPAPWHGCNFALECFIIANAFHNPDMN